MDLEVRNKIISAVLAVVILVLGYVLYQSITEPYNKVLEQQRETEAVREQMVKIRDALVVHDRIEGRFPGTLDSLIMFLNNHEAFDQYYEGNRVHIIRQRDTFLVQNTPLGSLLYSPRSNQRFKYTLNDTIRPQLYLLEDPDTDDHIGTLERTTLRNATSWN